MPTKAPKRTLPAKLNLRLPPELYRKLEKDAENRGLSLNSAIISRVEAAFQREQSIAEDMAALLGGARQARILQALAAITAADGYDESWADDSEQFNRVIDRWCGLLPTMAPKQSKKMQDRISHYREVLDRVNKGSASGLSEEHLLRLRDALRIAAGETGLPADLRAELAMVGADPTPPRETTR